MIGGVTRHMLPHLSGIPHLHANRPLADTNTVLKNSADKGSIICQPNSLTEPEIMNVLAKWLCSSCSGTTVKFRNVMVCFVYYGRRVSSQVAFDWRVSVHTQPNISVWTLTKTFKKTSLRAGESSKRFSPFSALMRKLSIRRWRDDPAGRALF